MPQTPPAPAALKKPSPLDSREIWARYYADLWQGGQIKTPDDVHRLIGELREVKKVRASMREMGLAPEIGSERPSVEKSAPTATTKAQPTASSEPNEFEKSLGRLPGKGADVVMGLLHLAAEGLKATAAGAGTTAGQTEKIRAGLDQAAEQAKLAEQMKAAEEAKIKAASDQGVAPAVSSAVAPAELPKPEEKKKTAAEILAEAQAARGGDSAQSADITRVNLPEKTPDEIRQLSADPSAMAELLSNLLPIPTEAKAATTGVARTYPRVVTKEKAAQEKSKTDIQQLMDVDAAAKRFGDATIGKVIDFLLPTLKEVQKEVPAAVPGASYEERQAAARARLQRIFERSPEVAFDVALLVAGPKAGKAKLEAGAAKAGREAAEAAGLSKAELVLPPEPPAALTETGAGAAQAGKVAPDGGLAGKAAPGASIAEPGTGPLEIQIPPEGKVPMPSFKKVQLEPGGKFIEPWKLTKAEAGESLIPMDAEIQTPEFWAKQHKLSVQKALSEGKKVPAKVLADYPDLAAKTKPKAPKVRLKQPFGSRNTIFTQEKFEAALQRAGKQRPQAGLDPQMFKDFTDIGGYYVEGGIREFGPWSEEMVKQLGEQVRPHLQRVYQQAVKNVEPETNLPATKAPVSPSVSQTTATKASAQDLLAPELKTTPTGVGGKKVPLGPPEARQGLKKGSLPSGVPETNHATEAFASNLRAAGVKSSEDFAVPSSTGKRRGPPGTPKKRPPVPPGEIPSSPAYMKPEDLPAFNGFKQKMGETWLRTRELWQDEYIRVRKLLERPDVKVSEATNLSDKQTLLFGRVGHRLKEADRIAADIDKGIITSAKELNLPDKELLDEVNKYLHYRHAPERNAALGEKAAGIGTAEAKAELAKLEVLPHASKIKELGGKISELNQKTLDILLDGEVIDQKLYDTLRKKYKNHVPLNRVFGESDDIVDVLASKGFDVRSTGIKRAVGSERPVADILTNVVANYKSAIARAEKNQLDLATLRFVRENKKALGDLFEEIRPKFIGKGAEEHPIFRRIDDPQVLQLREGGKPIYLKINDPHLATAMRGVNPLKQDVFVRWIGPMTRLYSGLATRFNPEFAIPNKIRDIQEAAIYAASRPEVGFKAAGGIIGREAKAQNILAVKDYLFNRNTEGAKLYRQMLEDGGATGGLSLSTRKAVELDINKIRALQRSKPRRAARQIIDWVDNLNEIFENSTRLSVYRQALADGLSRQKAAVLAKEATINFNKKGTFGPVLNSLYMFSNASIQGSAKMISALKNPKVAVAVVSSVGASTFATNEWNDSVDPDWREKVSKWDRFNGLPVLLSSEEKGGVNYFVIPISWGIKPIKVAADYTFDAAAGKSKGIADAISGVTAAVLESYNPLGGTDLKPETLVPSIAKPIFDVRLNRAWTGNPIRPDWDKYAPASTKYFQSLEKSPEGQAAIAATKKLSEVSGGRIEISPADVKYLYEQYISGVGRFGSSIVETVNEVAKGRAPKVSKIPVVRRFFRSRTAEELEARKGGETERVEKILTEQSRERFELNKQAEKTFEGLKQLPEDEILSRLEKLAETNYPLAKEAYEVWQDERLGLTREEKLVKQLGVENGARARYLFEKYQRLKPEERDSFLEMMQQKRILTEKVGEQLGELVDRKKEEMIQGIFK